MDTARERGATAVEYALMVGLIAIGIITAVTTLKTNVGDTLKRSGGSISGLIAPAKVSPGATFEVRYIPSGATSSSWVGLFREGDANTDVTRLYWKFLNNQNGVTPVTIAANGGTMTFVAPNTPGRYELVIFRDGGYGYPEDTRTLVRVE
jgi:pilus assembly protein Flp/PilA